VRGVQETVKMVPHFTGNWLPIPSFVNDPLRAAHALATFLFVRGTQHLEGKDFGNISYFVIDPGGKVIYNSLFSTSEDLQLVN